MEVKLYICDHNSVLPFVFLESLEQLHLICRTNNGWKSLFNKISYKNLGIIKKIQIPSEVFPTEIYETKDLVTLQVCHRKKSENFLSMKEIAKFIKF